MEPRKELYLYQELKNNSLPSSEDSLTELLKKKDIFDINPNTNFEIMKKYIGEGDEEKSMEEDDFDEQFKNFYLNYIQTLTFQQKIEIINKIKGNNKGDLVEEEIGLNEKSNMENYFDILNNLKLLFKFGSFEKYSKLKNLFFTKYYIDNESIKIPLIYGTNELKYGALISNLYQNLFIKNYSENNDVNNNENIIQFNNNNYPVDIAEKKSFKNNENANNNINNINDNINNINDNINDNNDNINDNNDNINDNNDIINDNNNINDSSNNKNINEDEDDEYSNIHYKINFIYKYLEKICDEEFYEFFKIKERFQLDETKNFKQDYQLNPQIDSLYFHLLYFDLVFSIYSYYGDKDYISTFEANFFEKKRDKWCFLNNLKGKFKIIKFENNQLIDFSNDNNVQNDIQNTDYLIIDLKNEKNTLKFNPYDYTFSKLRHSHIKTIDDIRKAFNNPNNFSLNLIYKNRRLFNNENLFKLFKENIKKMLSSNTINDLYNQFENFKEFLNPYKKEEFIEQTFDIILYLPIPFKIIGGFTYKNFGLVFLNNTELIKRNDSPDTFFCKNISHISFKKVTVIHEVVCHYTSAIIHANKKTIGLLTPPNSFIDYYPKVPYKGIFSEYDAGDRGETILFGNKIKYIFIKGALFILNKESWKLDLDNFKSKFIFSNNSKNSKNEFFNVEEECSKDEIIDNLKNNNSGLKEESFKIKKSLTFSFRLNSEYNDDNESFKDGVLYLNRVTHKSIISKKIKKNK